MTAVTIPENPKSKDNGKARRRRWIKKFGTRLFRGIDHYFARHSRVPNDPVLDPALFPWLKTLEDNWQDVQAEAMMLLQHREALPLFQDISPDQMRISPDDKWRTFFFYGFGHRSDHNCAICPNTARLLDEAPGIETAFFSILAPGKIVPSHHGITKGLIRAHLGLIVPPEPERCYMDVGEVRCTWEEGRILVFDDSYHHNVANNTDQERVVLLFDFPRPLSFPAGLVRRALFGVFKNISYVQDALRNEARWEQQQSTWNKPEPAVEAAE
jgi:beta-hydroxylase